MKRSKLCSGLAGCLFGVGLLSGCTIEAGISPAPPPRVVTGSVTVRWTIAGSDSPLQCRYYGVENLKLVVHDASRVAVVDTLAPCSSFAVTVDNLSPGSYNADATLVDSAESPRSLTLPINDIEITSGTELTINIDFPARSML